MKKIISLLIISIFLVSCTDNTKEEEITVQSPVIEDKIIKENTEVTKIKDEKGIENTKSGSENKLEKSVIKKDDNKMKTGSTIKEGTNEQTSTEDEKMLESEVNDLLDEFIDSLENYDK